MKFSRALNLVLAALVGVAAGMPVKVQAKDETRDIAGAAMPFGTVSLSLVLYDAGSNDPRKQAISRKTRGSLNPAKARKDALDLAMDEAIKEMRHELK